MGYKMNGFSGFGNSPLKSGLGLKHKSDSTGFDMDYDETDKEDNPTYLDPSDPKYDKTKQKRLYDGVKNPPKKGEVGTAQQADYDKMSNK